jgi:cysteine desulfurase
MNTIYLDNSATTPLCEAAKAAICEAMDNYGNPSSLHGEGLRAEALVKNARRQILSALGIRNPSAEQLKQLIFTACGTESNNTALLGVAYAKARREANRIVTTDSEHPSVENALQKLEKDGFEIVRIPTRGGVLDTEAATAALGEKTLLVTMMLVNNETGARYDIETVFREAKRRNPATVTHTDAVQGFLKCKFTPQSLCADLISISGHKIHAPKGVGALYINPDLLKTRRIIPYLIGGGQENGMRSGTENTIGIAAFGAAAADGAMHLDEHLSHMETLRSYAVDRLSSAGFSLNLPQGTHAPHIVNLRLPDIKSETMLHFLSAQGICISAGSACSSHGKHASPTLTAFGLSAAEADSSLRVSLSPYSTRDQIDALVDTLTRGAATLVRMRRR